ncbi:MAG: hypothetical protein ACI8P7_000633 [Candidatus Azotimanducaceae bacterium]|jgi:hypothetical protein
MGLLSHFFLQCAISILIKDYGFISKVPFKGVKKNEYIVLGLREEGIVHLYMKPNSVLDPNGTKKVV